MSVTQPAIQRADDIFLALQTMREILVAVWEKTSEKNFGPWFDDLLALFHNQSLTEGVRSLPIGILRQTIDNGVEKMFMAA